MKPWDDLAKAADDYLMSHPIVKVQPKTLAERLRYTEDPELRAKCRLVESFTEANKREIVDEVKRRYLDLILYGQTEWEK